MVVAGGAAGMALIGCGDSEDSGGSSTAAAGAPATINEVSGIYPDNFFAILTLIVYEMNYFEEEDLDVKTQALSSTTKAAQAMLSGRGDVAFMDPFGQMLAVSEGYDLKSFFSVWHGGANALSVLTDSPIKSVEELGGKTIGITSFAGGEVPGLRGILSNAGLEEGDYELVAIGDGGAEYAEALESDRVDAGAGSKADTWALRMAGVKLRSIMPAYTDDWPLHGWCCTPEYFDANADALTRFSRAYAKSVIFLRTNPQAGVEIAKKRVPESTEGLDDQQLLDFMKTVTIKFSDPIFEQGSEFDGRIGWQSVSAWESYQEVLIAGGAKEGRATLSEPVDVADVVDNSLVEGANDFDKAEVEAQAKAYKA